MLRTHRAGKGPGGSGGWGLGSRYRMGPGVPPIPGLRGQGTSPGIPAGSPCPSGQGKCPPLLSCSSRRAPCLPLLISPASLLCPQGPTWPRGGFGGQGNWLGSSAGSPAHVGQGITLHSSLALPGESLPPASPDLPSLRGTNLVWPPLLLPPRSPYVLLVHSGVPLLSLGVRVPHQQPAGALAVGRR